MPSQPFKSEIKVLGICPAFLWRAVLRFKRGPRRGGAVASPPLLQPLKHTGLTIYLLLNHTETCSMHARTWLCIKKWLPNVSNTSLKLRESTHTAGINSGGRNGEMFTGGVEMKLLQSKCPGFPMSSGRRWREQPGGWAGDRRGWGKDRCPHVVVAGGCVGLVRCPESQRLPWCSSVLILAYTWLSLCVSLSASHTCTHT